MTSGASGTGSSGGSGRPLGLAGIPEPLASISTSSSPRMTKSTAKPSRRNRTASRRDFRLDAGDWPDDAALDALGPPPFAACEPFVLPRLAAVPFPNDAILRGGGGRVCAGGSADATDDDALAAADAVSGSISSISRPILAPVPFAGTHGGGGGCSANVLTKKNKCRQAEQGASSWPKMTAVLTYVRKLLVKWLSDRRTYEKAQSYCTVHVCKQT